MRHKPTLTQEEKLVRMTESPLPGLIFSLAVPTIVSMLISALYNMADTYFVGLIGNASATGAIGVVFPLMSLMQAIAFMFGHGSGNHMSRSLGAGDVDDAEKYASTGFFSAMGAGVLLMVIGLVWTDPIVRLLGATETIAPYARDYVRCLMPGTPFLICSFVLNNQLRFQGSAFYGMIGITAGTILNIILDPVFIFVLDMQVAGAAIATAIGQAVSFAVLLFMTSRAGNIPIKPRRFCLNAETAKEIFRGGVPSLARQGLTSLATICLNVAAGVYGDAAIAGMSIVTRIMQFANSCLIGFGQGFQPVCGFNYGAGLYHRVKEGFWFSVKVTFVLLLAVSAAGFAWAPQLVSIFRDDPEVIAIGTAALRFQCVTFCLQSWVVMGNMMQQSMGKTVPATFMAVARQGLFFIPMVWILSAALGFTGVQLSQSAADLITFAVSIPVQARILRELPQDKIQKTN